MKKIMKNTKKYRLTKVSKIMLTIVIILASVFIHHLMGDFGAKLQNSIIYLPMVILGWIWLLLGQFGAFMILWEEN